MTFFFYKQYLFILHCSYPLETLNIHSYTIHKGTILFSINPSLKPSDAYRLVP